MLNSNNKLIDGLDVVSNDIVLDLNRYSYCNIYNNYGFDFNWFKSCLLYREDVVKNISRLLDNLVLYYSGNGIKIYMKVIQNYIQLGDTYSTLLIVYKGDKIYGIDMSYIDYQIGHLTKNDIQSIVLKNIEFGYSIEDKEARKIYFNLIIKNLDVGKYMYKSYPLVLRWGKYSYDLVYLDSDIDMRCVVSSKDSVIDLGSVYYKVSIDVVSKDMYILKYNIKKYDGYIKEQTLVDVRNLGIKYRCGNVFNSKLDISIQNLEDNVLVIKVQDKDYKYSLM